MNHPATEPRLGSEQHDLVLMLALGALAAAQAFERLTQASADSEPISPDDPVVLASLGVLAVADTLKRWLQESASLPLPAASPASTIVATPRELLR